MENPASFNLNEAIRRWRENLARLPSLRAENVEELESHLRDSVSRWHASGLTEEEAWNIAQQRVGENEILNQEFAKINPPVRTWRAITSMMLAIIIATLFFQADHSFTSKVWWTFFAGWLESSVAACAWVLATFLILVFPVMAVLRKLKRELSWWSAFALGSLSCAFIWLLLAISPRTIEIGLLFAIGGPLACGFAAATYARWKTTRRTAQIVSGAWMGIGGAAVCGLSGALLGDHSPPWNPGHLRDIIVAFLLGPPIAALACSCFAFPAGAVAGAWLPRRLREAGSGKSFAMGLAIGAAAGILAVFLHFLTWELPILNTRYDPTQRELVQEAFLRETLVLFRNVVPTAALWVGWWALRWNKRMRKEIPQPRFKPA